MRYMMLKQRAMVLTAVLAMVLPAGLLRAAEVFEPSEFLRFVEENDGGRLEAAIVTYRNADGATVQLVSAVHVAERAYYRALNERFAKHDAVLYEMIKPAGAPAPRPGAQSGGAVSALQRMLQTLLELDFQLDAIDYTPRHFVHADLDVDTFFRMQRERGESIVTMMLNVMIQELARGPQGRETPQVGLAELMMAMQSPDRARQLKLLLARQFGEMDRLIAGLEGPDGSVLLTERNKAAIRALEQTLAEGRRNIAIFYGAAHMNDLEARLMQLGGFERVNHEWKIAWDMME
jgi:hypothetical protein